MCKKQEAETTAKAVTGDVHRLLVSHRQGRADSLNRTATEDGADAEFHCYSLHPQRPC